jgi:hypothetical protein
MGIDHQNKNATLNRVLVFLAVVVAFIVCWQAYDLWQAIKRVNGGLDSLIVILNKDADSTGVEMAQALKDAGSDTLSKIVWLKPGLNDTAFTDIVTPSASTTVYRDSFTVHAKQEPDEECPIEIDVFFACGDLNWDAKTGERWPWTGEVIVRGKKFSCRECWDGASKQSIGTVPAGVSFGITISVSDSL